MDIEIIIRNESVCFFRWFKNSLYKTIFLDAEKGYVDSEMNAIDDERMYDLYYKQIGQFNKIRNSNP